jgi:putative ABC transport system substrate-binding protein
MRDFSRRGVIVTVLGGAAAWPPVARAQQTDRVRRIGMLMNGAATETILQLYVASFVQGLRQLGWLEGQNVRIDIRWNAGDAALARIYAAQLIGLQPDVIVTPSTTNLMILQQATSALPIVFLQVSDPVAQGFVASVAHPGGNLTGFSAYEFSIGSKWLDLLKEIAPGLARVAIVFNPDTSPQSKFFVRSVEAAATPLGLGANAVPVRTTDGLASAVESFASAPNGGLILTTDSFTRLHGKLIAELASRHRLPAIAADEEFPRQGGLLGYGVNVNLIDHFRRAASYVDRILKGEKPADMPVQQPDKYKLIVNLRTSKALGLNPPLPLLGLADEVIE